MKPPTIPQMADAYLHASDETRSHITQTLSGLVQVYLLQWVWKRTVRKSGPALAKLLAGEELSSSETRVLLTSLTVSCYLVARNAYIGWSAAKQLQDSTAPSSKPVNHKLGATI